MTLPLYTSGKGESEPRSSAAGCARSYNRFPKKAEAGTGWCAGTFAWEKELTAGPRLPEGVRSCAVRKAGKKRMRAAADQGPHMSMSRAIAGLRLDRRGDQLVGRNRSIGPGRVFFFSFSFSISCFSFLISISLYFETFKFKFNSVSYLIFKIKSAIKNQHVM
jgi:hypothetical protein